MNKFRAWAKKTIDHYISDPIDISNSEFENTEPSNKNSIEWDIWYQDRENRMQEIRNTMDSNADDRYEVTYLMITDFSIKGDGKITRPYGYEILDVMQYIGIYDNSECFINKFDNDIDLEDKEICRGDIVSFIYNNEEYIGVVEFEIGSFIISSSKLPDGYVWLHEITNIDRDYCWINGLVIGNIYENSELIK